MKNFKKQKPIELLIIIIAMAVGYLGYSIYTEIVPMDSVATKFNKRLGMAIIVIAYAILAFRHWIVKKIMRFATVILVALAIILEPILHYFGIPHTEGLWIPLLEGGAVLGVLVNYWKNIKMKIDEWFRKLMKNSRRQE